MSRAETFEFKAMDRMHLSQWENVASIRPGKFGATTRDALLSKGWIELRGEKARQQVRLTQAGVDALAAWRLRSKQASQEPRRSTLKPPPPRISSPPSRVREPGGKK